MTVSTNPTTAELRTEFRHALLGMARELWVARDRQRVLEQLLAERGVVAADAIDAYQPPAALQADLDAECRALIERLTAGY